MLYCIVLYCIVLYCIVLYGQRYIRTVGLVSRLGCFLMAHPSLTTVGYRIMLPVEPLSIVMRTM